MKIKVKNVDKDRNMIEVGRGKKRKSWIQVQVRKERIDISTCQNCAFSKICNLKNPMCNQIISEVISQGYFFHTPTHFNFIKC